MRYFQTLAEAVPEIQRDLYKSPRYRSGRVQHLRQEGFVHEAQNYAYTLQQVPEDPSDILEIAADNISLYRDDSFRRRVESWMVMESSYRLNPLKWRGNPDELHPVLVDMMEGNAYAYTYQERLMGAEDALVKALLEEPTTRRAFWPIFQPTDGLRAAQMTRIPCSIGYHAAIREVEGHGEMLHLTYLQRSCDAEVFWLTDVWMARQFQRHLLLRLRQRTGRDIRLGHFSHIILSFHRFIPETVEEF